MITFPPGMSQFSMIFDWKGESEPSLKSSSNGDVAEMGSMEQHIIDTNAGKQLS